MFKNVATKITMFAFDFTTGQPKTGDAANLTCYLSKDFVAPPTILTDTSATEKSATLAPGEYNFDVTQAEANANQCDFSAVSTTPNIVVVPVRLATLPAAFGVAGGAAGGVLIAGVNAATSFVGLTADLLGSVLSVVGFNPVDVSAIRAKTDNLPSDPADQSVLIAAMASLPASTLAAFQATTDWMKMVGNVDGAFAFTAPSVYPGTGVLVLKNKANTVTLATITLTFDANQIIIARSVV